MAEIPGATIDFTDYSAPGTPRVLNIPDAAGDVTLQDIWDTLSAKAAELHNLVYKKLIDRPKGGGKSFLSLTKTGGITCSMNNVKVKFEDLGGPAYTIKRVTDGNLVARDAAGDPMEPMENSTFVNWKLELDVSAALLSSDAAEVAQEVWSATTRILTSSQNIDVPISLAVWSEILEVTDLTTKNIMRGILAMLSGKVSGPLDDRTFYAPDGVTPRVRIRSDEFGTRTEVILTL